MASESESQPRRHHPLARQFGVGRQWIQTVVLAHSVKQSHGDLAPASWKAIAQLEVQLPEFVAGQLGPSTTDLLWPGLDEFLDSVVLMEPVRLSAGEETGRMVEEKIGA